ncbi:phage head closure protein [Devosia sp. XK-2]|uniref:phage head closure protein n=1 Tax=Devosia sp. XK-2 TaxID=3126689 RepID=UPI0030D4D4C3
MSGEKIPAIGTLTDRVQLKRRETSSDGVGGHERLYVPVTHLWARVRSLSGRQGTNADGRVVAISHSVVLRFRNDVSPGDRIVYRGRNLDVVSMADLNGRRAYLSCACSETSFTG